MTEPMISVVMSVFNGESFLKEAVDSILGQTFSDFEFIIIDDASEDSSREIILSYRDPRIVLVENERNLGLTKSLNAGISRARGKYIARMDADDISLPERFERQVEFMEANPDCTVCGTWGVGFGPRLQGEIRIEPVTESHKVQTELLFANALIHGSTVMRNPKDSPSKWFYDESIERAQDLHLWILLVKRGCRLANLPIILYRYRMHAQAISTFALLEQERSAEAAMRNLHFHVFGTRIPLILLRIVRGRVQPRKMSFLPIASLFIWVISLRLFSFRSKPHERFDCMYLLARMENSELKRIANPILWNWLKGSIKKCLKCR